MDDWQLLNDYATRNSEEAFRTLVERYAGMVYHTALRQLGNPHSAEEVAQVVFIILAQKAAKIRRQPTLYGWLFRATRFAVLNQRRQEKNRARREQEAYAMQSASNPDDLNPVWEQITPHLDDALHKLPATDRELVMIRYFGNKSHKEAAQTLGVSEDVARKRLSRAMEKLRVIFARRGVAVSSLALVAAFTAHGVQAAPLGLASSLAGVAVAKGATAPISTLTLIKGALKIMAWTKVKTAVVAAAVVIVAAGTTTVAVKRISSPSVDESLWSVNSDNFSKAPPVLIIRPARYPNRAGSVEDGNRIIGLNMPISGLLIRAYGPDLSVERMIFPPGVARQHFDLMLTLPDHESESLRNKLKTQLGLVARRELIETNVLWLKVKDAATLQSRISKGGSPMGYLTSDISSAKIVITNQPISTLAAQLESLLQFPTVDQTGLNKNFDISLKWNRVDPQHDSLKNALLDQLGLELVPGTTPVEMLVVEKAK